MIRSLTRVLGNCFGWIWCDVIRVRRSIVEQNLAIAFPKKSKEERLAILRAYFAYLGQLFFETLFLPFMRRRQVMSYVEMSESDWKPVRECLAEKKGAFFLTAHLGNWEFGSLYGRYHNVPISVVTKTFSNPILHRLWTWLRRRSGIEYIASYGTAREVISSVKRGRFVAMMLDQHMQPPVGVATRFFGIEVGTIRSLASLSLHCQVPVIPFFVIQDSDGKYHLHTEGLIRPPAACHASEQRDELIRSMTQEYCDIIQRWVTKAPEQWNWLHRRFKYSYDYHKKSPLDRTGSDGALGVHQGAISN